jgi:hypothetical protein
MATGYNNTCALPRRMELGQSRSSGLIRRLEILRGSRKRYKSCSDTIRAHHCHCHCHWQHTAQCCYQGDVPPHYKVARPWPEVPMWLPHVSFLTETSERASLLQYMKSEEKCQEDRAIIPCMLFLILQEAAKFIFCINLQKHVFNVERIQEAVL